MEAPSANRDLIMQVIEKIGSLQPSGHNNPLYTLLIWGALPLCVAVVICVRTAIVSAIPEKAFRGSFSFAIDVGIMISNLGYMTGLIIPVNIFEEDFQTEFKSLIREQFQDEQNIPIRQLLHNTSGSFLTHMSVSKEKLFLLTFLMVTFCFSWFSTCLVQMIKIFCFFYNEDPEKRKDPEERPQGHPHCNITDLANEPIYKSQNFKLKEIVRRGTATFVAAFCICVFIVPRKFISNTTMILYGNLESQLIVTTDHIYLALMLAFLMSNTQNLFKALNHTHTSCYTRVFPNIISFIWFYNGLLAMALLMMLRLFNDTLMNLAFSIIEEATQMSAFNEDHIHKWTLFLLEYFKHYTDSKCFHQACSVEEKIDSMVENFTLVNRLFYKVSTVVAVVCFIAVPIVLWAVLVEWKLKSYGNLKNNHK